MRIELKFRDDDARRIAYFLQRKFGGKAKLDSQAALTRMIKLLIREAVAEQAKDYLAEINKT